MAARSHRRIAHGVLGALLLGVATVMAPKVRPDDHWSDSPRVVIVVETEADANAEPAGLPMLDRPA